MFIILLKLRKRLITTSIVVLVTHQSRRIERTLVSYKNFKFLYYIKHSSELQKDHVIRLTVPAYASHRYRAYIDNYYSHLFTDLLNEKVVIVRGNYAIDICDLNLFLI